jgi:hypothetical protein
VVATLHDLQAAMGCAMLGGDATLAEASVHGDGLGAAARLAVYRHHVLGSLTAVLESIYPVVVRLVDARFFRYAADRYIHAHPPLRPCLFEYGATFGDFLARFTPTRHLAYLPDVARLEWALNAALNAPDLEVAMPQTLSPASSVAFHPSVSLLRSSWPIDSIWRANQPGHEGEVVDLQTGGVCLQIWRVGDEVVFRRLSIAEDALRRALTSAGRLDAAAEAALAADATADLAALVRGLLEEELLVRPLPGTEKPARVGSRLVPTHGALSG